MMLDKDDMLNSILNSLAHLDYIKSNDIPNIDLYMDQVTTFMDDHLGASRRGANDKILTKTMINNYAKNHLLPPPVKKKYSKEHLLVLIFIYYFKGFLSFQDIQSILNPLTERFFHSEKSFSIEDVYNEVFQLGKMELEHLKEDVQRMYHTAADSFSEADEEDSEFLHTFSMICLLSFDIYVKKQLLEQIINSSPGAVESKNKKPKETS